MTAQISDVYSYNGEEFRLIAIENEINFDLEKEYNIKCVPPHTGLWRGHYEEFDVLNDELILRNINACIKGDYPVINGVTAEEFDFGLSRYNDVNIPIKYTGSILLGNGFIRDYYIHMGFQQPYAYRVVLELKFKDGVLINKTDYSDKMQELRETLKDKSDLKRFLGDNFSHEDFISQCFSTSYRDKMPF